MNHQLCEHVVLRSYKNATLHHTVQQKSPHHKLSNIRSVTVCYKNQYYHQLCNTMLCYITLLPKPMLTMGCITCDGTVTFCYGNLSYCTLCNRILCNKRKTVIVSYLTYIVLHSIHPSIFQFVLSSQGSRVVLQCVTKKQYYCQMCNATQCYITLLPKPM